MDSSHPNPLPAFASPSQSNRSSLVRKQVGLFWLLGVLGGIAVLPYALTLQADQIAQVTRKTGLSLFSLAVIGAAQTSVLLLLAVPIGFWAARRVGFSAPLSESLLLKKPIPSSVRSAVWPSVALGILAALAMIAADGFLFLPRLPELAALNRSFATRAPISYGVLACLYGAVTEELLLRLLVMSLLSIPLTWLFQRRNPGESLHPLALWTANIAAALLFGIGHLPAAKAILPMSTLLVLRTIVMNGVVGLVCGWLYARRGLELAMIAHGAADVVLHVLAPLLVMSGILSV